MITTIQMNLSDIPKFHSTELIFEPRDLWVGVYWDRPQAQRGGTRWLLIFFCLIPMLPLKIRFKFKTPQP
jgi:hypothetical protein